jgi:hypothetical protein
MPDEPAPDDDCDDPYRLGADVDEDDAAGAAGVDGAEAALVDVVGLELEPHPAITSAPSMSAPVTSRRTELAGIAMSIVWSFR